MKTFCNNKIMNEMNDPIIKAEERIRERENRDMTFEEFTEAFSNIFINFE